MSDEQVPSWLIYDPYEWFDPEYGRIACGGIRLEVGILIGAQIFTPKRFNDYFESLCGVRELRHMPFEKLPLVLKAIAMLHADRLRRKSPYCKLAG